jgi:hypothetical protein
MQEDLYGVFDGVTRARAEFEAAISENWRF